MSNQLELDRDEKFSRYIYEWIKTERAGEISKFQKFEIENEIEYLVFEDNSRIKTSLLGDIVLMHVNDSEILGAELSGKDLDVPLDQLMSIQNNFQKPTIEPTKPTIKDPVFHILEKTKKKSERINISVNIKIPSIDVYKVIKENFDNVDDILLTSVIEQIDEKVIRDAVKKELLNIYSQKKKRNDGKDATVNS